jgi:hypothetical protein
MEKVRKDEYMPPQSLQQQQQQQHTPMLYMKMNAIWHRCMANKSVRSQRLALLSLEETQPLRSPSAEARCHGMINCHCFDRSCAGVVNARQLHNMPEPE